MYYIGEAYSRRYLVIRKNWESYYILTRRKRLKLVKNVKLIKKVSSEIAQKFIEYYINNSTKRGKIYVPQYLLKFQEFRELLAAYDLEVVTNIFNLKKSALAFAYEQLKDVIDIKIHKYFLSQRAYIPFSLINNFVRGYVKQAYYSDISAAYPSSYKKDMPGSVISSRSSEYIALVQFEDFCDELPLIIRFDKNYLLKNTEHIINIKHKQVWLYKDLLELYDDAGCKYKILKKIYFEPVDLYDIYRKAMYIRQKEKNLGKLVANAMSFGFVVKYYLPLAIAVTHRLIAFLLNELRKYEQHIYDIYVDAIIGSYKPSSNALYTFKHEQLKDIILGREGILLANNELRRAVSYTSVEDALTKETKMYLPIKNAEYLKHNAVRLEYFSIIF